MSEGNSYRQILRSSSIIGGASVINVVISLFRMKAVAVLLGPAGVGLIGLFTNLAALASNLAGLGFGNVGTRQVAEAVGKGDMQHIATARRALFWGSLALALGGALLLWLLRATLANHVLGDAALAPQIGWLSLAVALTVAAASQNALLNGMRRIGDIARVRVGSAIFATVFGLFALWLWGFAGIAAYVIAVPLGTFLLGHLFVARLPKVQSTSTDVRALLEQWKVLARLGAAFMVAGLAAVTAQLVVRAMVQRDLGPDALGQFQAAWAISMTYIGFVLSAMGTDFYPRLTAVIHDHGAVGRMVNEQTEIALLLAAPVLLAALALAPALVRLLYTADFAEAAVVLRWQVLGDFLKVASWPLGFIILASGAGRAFIFTEWFGMASFVILTWVGIPKVGIEATGMAFVGLYAVYLPCVYFLAVRRVRFSWTIAVLRTLLTTSLLAALILLCSKWSELAALIIGLIAALAVGLFSVLRLSELVGNDGRLGNAVTRSRQALALFFKMRR